MSGISDHDIARIKYDPDFRRLAQSRARLAWSLSVVMITIYFGFILLIAFDKPFVGQSLAGGVTTIGIPLGLGVIMAAFVLTGLYVARANATFDRLTANIVERMKR